MLEVKAKYNGVMWVMIFVNCTSEWKMIIRFLTKGLSWPCNIWSMAVIEYFFTENDEGQDNDTKAF